MPPSEFSLRLQYGISGGFLPPNPSAIHTITRSRESDKLQVRSSAKPPGALHTSALIESGLKSLTLGDDGLLDELHRILKVIPTEVPPGIQDIYGMDVSIAWGSEDLEWCNQGPADCGHGVSEVQPTEEHKNMFRRAVDIVNQLIVKAE